MAAIASRTSGCGSASWSDLLVAGEHRLVQRSQRGQSLFEGLGGKDGLLSLLPDVLVERGHDFKVEVVFGVEMVVEHRFVDPGGFGDSVDPGAVDTVAGELVYRGGDNFLPGSSGSGFGGHFALDI